MATKHANIRRKDNIPEEDRTEGKDEAAEIIDTLIDRGEWPVSLKELDDKTSWSRSHYRNVLRTHFEPVEEPDEMDIDTSDNVPSISIPNDVENVETYLRGVAAGYRLSKTQQKA